jgi:hypothetical protein
VARPRLCLLPQIGSDSIQELQEIAPRWLILEALIPGRHDDDGAAASDRTKPQRLELSVCGVMSSPMWLCVHIQVLQ